MEGLKMLIDLRSVYAWLIAPLLFGAATTGRAAAPPKLEGEYRGTYQSGRDSRKPMAVNISKQTGGRFACTLVPQPHPEYRGTGSEGPGGELQVDATSSGGYSVALQSKVDASRKSISGMFTVKQNRRPVQSGTFTVTR
jgi:hypothetical protein